MPISTITLDEAKLLFESQGVLSAAEALGGPLAAMAGDWSVQGDGVEALAAAGVEVRDENVQSKLVLGGRYLETHYSASIADSQYSLVSILGFDTSTGTYVETVSDSLGNHFGFATSDFEVSNRGVALTHEFEGKNYVSEYRVLNTNQVAYRLVEVGKSQPLKAAVFERQA